MSTGRGMPRWITGATVLVLIAGLAVAAWLLGDEEVVRAMMAARANAMVYDGPSPQLAQMLVDLLNHQITPVVMLTLPSGVTPLAGITALG